MKFLNQLMILVGCKSTLKDICLLIIYNLFLRLPTDIQSDAIPLILGGGGK
jgi:hypothetical protein